MIVAKGNERTSQTPLLPAQNLSAFICLLLGGRGLGLCWGRGGGDRVDQKWTRQSIKVKNLFRTQPDGDGVGNVGIMYGWMYTFF